MDQQHANQLIAVLAEMLSEERRMLTDMGVCKTSALLWSRGRSELRIVALQAAIEALKKERSA